jgi:hypothetical protein
MNKWYMSKMSGDTAVIPWTLVAFGCLLLVIGVVLITHHSHVNSECNSTLGQFGQALSSQLQSQCSRASHDTGLGDALALIGFISLLMGIRTVIASRALVAASKLASR